MGAGARRAQGPLHALPFPCRDAFVVEIHDRLHSHSALAFVSPSLERSYSLDRSKSRPALVAITVQSENTILLNRHSYYTRVAHAIVARWRVPPWRSEHSDGRGCRCRATALAAVRSAAATGESTRRSPLGRWGGRSTSASTASTPPKGTAWAPRSAPSGGCSAGAARTSSSSPSSASAIATN